MNNNKKKYILTFDEFIRSVNVNKLKSHTLFLGCGTSISSGILSANDCIWQWKRDIYLTNNSGIENHFQGISSDYIKDKIQKWLDSQNTFPMLDSENEYSIYAEKAHPIASDRRQFFQNLISKATPYIGYQLLPFIIKDKVIDSIWTTNFDNLINRVTTAAGIATIEVGLDTPARAIRVLNEDELLLVQLHGDYRYDDLKNTEKELKNQDTKLREEFIKKINTTHTIVAGYSGRDKSIMECFNEAYSTSGNGRLYWTDLEPEPNHKVKELLKMAQDNNRQAYYIQIQDFDDLIIKLVRHCISKEELKKEALTIYNENYKKEISTTPFTLNQTDKVSSIIKSNMFIVEIPKDVFQFECNEVKGEKVWNKLKNIIKGYQICAVPLKGKILAISSIEELQKAFDGKIMGEIERTPIDNEELSINNSSISSLLINCITTALAEKYDLLYFKNKLWEKSNYKNHFFNSKNYHIHRATILSFKVYNNIKYITIKPDVLVLSADNSPVSKETIQEIKKQILDKQRNKEFNEDMEYWRKEIIFLDNKDITIKYPSNNSTFSFTIKKNPIFTSVTKSSIQNLSTLDSSTKHLFKQNGIEYEEPKLLFCSSNGDKYFEDTHPIRGLLKNKPYDISLTLKDVSPKVNLSIICPKSHNGKLHEFLMKQHSNITVNHNQDYLLDYPGFSQVYGLPLNIPSISDDRWMTIEKNIESSDIKSGARELAKLITDKIESSNHRDNIDVIVIFIPEYWEKYTNYKSDKDTFDLHNYIKSFSVQRGIATQLLREKTIKPTDMSCQIHWWLSLAFYVKSLRTPWVLKSLENNTAFAGIGYSIKKEDNGSYILMGCSHIFNSQGEGLKYKLSRLEESYIKHDNPYLSYNDAFRFGNSIRQMFYQSLGSIPKRVVVHKRTYYSKDEIRGIMDALNDVEIVDLIEINYEENLRYVSSSIKNGKPVLDGYPIRRGTTVLLDSTTALLWNHGRIPSVKNSDYNFYLGGRRIPAPLNIKKHYGSSTLDIIINDILGLSKMHWNTLDYYTQLPVTIRASNEIAKIASNLSRFDNRTYDYRYFI